MTVPVGTRLGPYEILALLGAGAMGKVYKARDTRLNRVVAIKKLTGPHTNRFEQEARALAALNHPHICQLYDEPYALLGAVAAAYDYDWKEAEREFQVALAREPVSPLVRDWYATFYLLPTGRARDGMEELERALEEDPLNWPVRSHLAMCLQAAGREVEASAQFRHILEFAEFLLPVYCWLCVNYALRGMLEDAVACAEKAYALGPWHAEAIAPTNGTTVRRPGTS